MRCSSGLHGLTLACTIAIVASLPLTIVQAETLEAQITYVTGKSVYVDAGKSQGLLPGTSIEVLRDGEVIATLAVTEATSTKASCSIVESRLTPEVGDKVRFSISAPAGAAVAATDEPAASGRRARRGGLPVRGRIGVQYLAFRDGTNDHADYSQPALDLRLDAAGLGSGNWGFHVDARARRITRNLVGGGSDDENRTRVYRLSVDRGTRSDPWSFALGRQYSPSLANVALFDGISAAHNRGRWSVGLFSGSEPDSEDFGYNGDLRQHGVYYDLHSAESSAHRWSVTTGLVGAYDGGEIDREFAYVQTRWIGEKLLGYLVQEIDINRDWKKDEAGESSFEPTSTMVSLRYRVRDGIDLVGGFDNRRRVRLLRDRITPATQFDDEFRRGFWGGANFRFAKRLSLSLDGRMNSGDPSGDSDAFTGKFGVNRLTHRNLSLHLRATRFTNEMLEGWLYSGDAGLDLGSRVYLRLEAGVRDEESLISPTQDDSLSWISLDVDVNLSRRWYLLMALEHSSGDLEEYDQLFTRLSYRF